MIRLPAPTPAQKATASHLTLRDAQPADEPFLISLRQSTMTSYLRAAGEPTDGDSCVARVRYRYTDAKIICVGADAAGMIKAQRCADHWHIVQVQVLPAYQRRGIGGDAIRAVLERAGREGLAVSLSVLKLNPARALYERMGFHIESDSGNAYRMTTAAPRRA